MKSFCSFTLLLATAFAENRPAGVNVNTWVREDLFAGMLTGSMPQFEQGMQKLDGVLAEEPTNVDALAWRGGGKLLYAVRAHEAGDAEAFQRHYQAAQADFAKATREADQRPAARIGLHAITGGTHALMADRFPPALRNAAWLAARDHYQALRSLQKPFEDKLPLHIRGELLAGLAQANQRLGDLAATTHSLTELIEALPDSVYATRARKWQSQPETAARTSLICQTCHDAGRLEPALKRLKDKQQ